MTSPKYFWSKTLLGCPPDHDQNIRYLYADGKQTHAFNERMKLWPKDGDAKLQQICDNLNDLNKVGKE